MQTLKKTFSAQGVKATLKVDGKKQVYVTYKTPQGCSMNDFKVEQIEPYAAQLNALEKKIRVYCEANDLTLWSY